MLQGFSADSHLALFAAGTVGQPEFESDGSNPGASTNVAAVVVFYPSAGIFLDPNEADLGNQFPPVSMEPWAEHLCGDEGTPSWLLLSPGVTEEEVRQISPLTSISPQYLPTLLMHGTLDTVVPHTTSVRFHQALLATRVHGDFHVFSELPHGFDTAPSMLKLTQEESVLFFCRMVVEPNLVEREFGEAMAAMMALVSANMPPSGSLVSNLFPRDRASQASTAPLLLIYQLARVDPLTLRRCVPSSTPQLVFRVRCVSASDSFSTNMSQ